MRYVPGITWQRLIERLGGADRAGDCGATLLRWLDDEAAAASPPPEGPRRAALAGSSLVATACRLVAEVARALDYAHQQGVLHRDIKPANLLLASDGRAMLMDFNVASSAAEALGDVAVLGGTAAYMAPEHLAAFDPLRPAQPAAIDRRADIYSLGVVFYELLTGRHPFRLLEASPPRGIERMTAERWRGAPPLSAAGLSTSAGLESIVGQCLAADPNRRYATAGALAEDLGRWLAHEPLRFAPERSRAERWAKWARRHARALAASAGAAAVLTAIVIGTAAMIHVRLGRARSCLDRASATLAERKAVAAAAELLAAEQYLSGPDWLFLGAGADDSRDRLRARFRQLARDAAGQQGRDFRAAASTLRLWDVANRPRVDDVLNIFAVLERPDWQRLPTWKHATRFGPSPLEDDVAEFLALKAWARIREAATAASSSPVQDEVRLLLSRVPLRHQSSVVLRKLLELSASAEPLPLSLDDDERARCREFDWYLVGMLHAAGGQFEPASQEFGQALASSSPVPRPRFWAVFMRSYCLAQLGKTQLAIDGYRQCLDLQPLAPWTHFNLGLLYHGQGEAERAIEHFEIALAQDPKMGAAHNNIGVARCAQGRYREAVESFHRAIETGYRAVDVYLNRGSARAALQQRDRAREDFQTALQLDPHCERAREKLRLLDQLP
jgi:tetratricopeptide (TPR) repeat protein